MGRPRNVQIFKTHVCFAIVLPIRSFVSLRSRCRRHRVESSNEEEIGGVQL